MNFDTTSFEALPGKAPFPMILDTDTYNEIDDQFALVYSIFSPDRIDLKGVTAAPFFNDRSTSAGDGMERSFHEIEHILALTGMTGKIPAKRGSASFMKDRNTPVHSEAAEFIIAEAKKAHERKEKLFIAAIAAITNVASALLLAPEIAENLVVIWLGGHAQDYPGTPREFNLQGDIPAAQVVFRSGVSLIQLPAMGVVSSLEITRDELLPKLAGCGKVGEYLKTIFVDYMKNTNNAKVIWDITAVAYLVIPEATKWEIIPRPELHDDCTWESAPGNPLTMKRAVSLDRMKIYDDLFSRIVRAR